MVILFIYCIAAKIYSAAGKREPFILTRNTQSMGYFYSVKIEKKPCYLVCTITYVVIVSLSVP